MSVVERGAHTQPLNGVSANACMGKRMPISKLKNVPIPVLGHKRTMHMHDESIAELGKQLISVPAGGPMVRCAAIMDPRPPDQSHC